VVETSGSDRVEARSVLVAFPPSGSSSVSLSS